MAKKENLDPTAGLAFGVVPQAKVIETHNAHEVQHVQEAQMHKDTLNNTQGRKGHKLPRINMAFTHINHDYVKRTSRRLGISATEYVNNLIDDARSRR